MLTGPALLGVLCYILLFFILKKVAKASGNEMLVSLRRHLRTPSLLFILALTMNIALPFAKLSVVPGGVEPAAVDPFGIARRVLGIVMIFAISWMVIESTSVLEDALFARFDIDASDNLRARKVKTQLQVFKKVVVFIVVVFALSLVLMSFEKVRQLGTTILASAGVIGIIVGFAAQRTIAALLAGIQIAITQPFRIDDVLVVENEWGWVEEITLTYVVVRIWDLRRLILPMSYFIDKPFQNWTRTSAAILGTVFIYADYSVPLAELREELHRILKESPLWDGKVWNVQVTGATDKGMEIRALMSASDSPSMWDLRCAVREKLLEFVALRHPGALPRMRGELVGGEMGAG
jgi:small-conductance mechanosensitive channel